MVIILIANAPELLQSCTKATQVACDKTTKIILSQNVFTLWYAYIYDIPVLVFHNSPNAHWTLCNTTAMLRPTGDNNC